MSVVVRKLKTLEEVLILLANKGYVFSVETELVFFMEDNMIKYASYEKGSKGDFSQAKPILKAGTLTCYLTGVKNLKDQPLYELVPEIKPPSFEEKYEIVREISTLEEIYENLGLGFIVTFLSLTQEPELEEGRGLKLGKDGLIDAVSLAPVSVANGNLFPYRNELPTFKLYAIKERNPSEES